jgi:hypothetical protein
MSKINITDSCWIWSGAKNRGYGTAYFEGRQQGVHRIMYQMAYGEIPEAMFICHSCDNPECVNPDHLFAGTQKQNMEDRSNKGRHANQKKTHCPMGHEYNEENTYVSGPTQGRKCLQCRSRWAVKRKKY